MANDVQHFQFDFQPEEGPDGWSYVGVVVDREGRDWAMTATVPDEQVLPWMVEATKEAATRLSGYTE